MTDIHVGKQTPVTCGMCPRFKAERRTVSGKQIGNCLFYHKQVAEYMTCNPKISNIPYTPARKRQDRVRKERRLAHVNSVVTLDGETFIQVRQI